MADRLVNEFIVNRPIAEAWVIVCDLERIAPCLPGARLDAVEGAVHRGSVRVKLGAIAAEFRGEASFVERDDAAHTALLIAKGRDVGGRGSASAQIAARAEELGPRATRIVLETELSITGKVAQLGRGVMNDVSRKLLTQFADNLDAALMAGDAANSGSGAPVASPGEALDLGAVVGPALLKRLLPVVAVLVLLALFVGRRRR